MAEVTQDDIKRIDTQVLRLHDRVSITERNIGHINKTITSLSSSQFNVGLRVETLENKIR